MNAMTTQIKHIAPKFRCPECYEVHDTNWDATHCCPVEAEEIYVCPICEEEHDFEDQALECCPDPDADPDDPTIVHRCDYTIDMFYTDEVRAQP